MGSDFVPTSIPAAEFEAPYVFCQRCGKVNPWDYWNRWQGNGEPDQILRCQNCTLRIQGISKPRLALFVSLVTREYGSEKRFRAIAAPEKYARLDMIPENQILELVAKRELLREKCRVWLADLEKNFFVEGFHSENS